MYWINPNNSDMRGGCRAFTADTSADIQNLPTANKRGVQQGDDVTSCLPCAKGSTCMVLSPASYYTLNSSDNWILL